MLAAGAGADPIAAGPCITGCAEAIASTGFSIGRNADWLPANAGDAPQTTKQNPTRKTLSEAESKNRSIGPPGRLPQFVQINGRFP